MSDPTVADIWLVKHMFLQGPIGLPLEIIDEILDLAEYWAHQSLEIFCPPEFIAAVQEPKKFPVFKFAETFPIGIWEGDTVIHVQQTPKYFKTSDEDKIDQSSIGDSSHEWEDRSNEFQLRISGPDFQYPPQETLGAARGRYPFRRFHVQIEMYVPKGAFPEETMVSLEVLHPVVFYQDSEDVLRSKRPDISMLRQCHWSPTLECISADEGKMPHFPFRLSSGVINYRRVTFTTRSGNEMPQDNDDIKMQPYGQYNIDHTWFSYPHSKFLGDMFWPVDEAWYEQKYGAFEAATKEGQFSEELKTLLQNEHIEKVYAEFKTDFVKLLQVGDIIKVVSIPSDSKRGWATRTKLSVYWTI
jgi:hypothetical protein